MIGILRCVKGKLRRNALDTGLPRAGVDEPRYDIVAAARQLENYYMALLRECDLPGERQ